MNQASEEKRCDMCGMLIPWRKNSMCGECLNLRNLIIPLMRNETARAFLLSQFLSNDDANAIMDMHALTATFGCGPRTNPRRKAWKRLVGLARKLTERET